MAPDLKKIDNSRRPTPSVSSETKTQMGSPKSLTFVNPLTITGMWYLYISANVSPDQPGNTDVAAPMVWGGVHIHNARTNADLGAVCTDTGVTAGHFNITIENSLSDGFYVQVLPVSDYGEVKTGMTGGDYVLQPPTYWYPPAGMTNSIGLVAK